MRALGADFQLDPACFAGAVDLERVNGGIRPFRLRAADRDLLHPELSFRAAMASGVRIELATNATRIELDLDWTANVAPGEALAVDAVIDGGLIQSHRVEPGRHITVVDGLPAGAKQLQLWLPQFGSTVVHGWAISDGACAGPWAVDSRQRWVTYGSSITHGRHAYSPARTWPAIVARTHQLNLTSMGFGGQCHFDPLVGRTIRDLSADLISMKLGINTHGGSFSQRTWQQAVIGLVLTIRDGHPDTPLLLVSPIFGCQREMEAAGTGMTLRMMRGQLADVVETFRSRGDAHIHYLDGLKLLSGDETELLPDQLHPSGEGHERIGRRFGELTFGPGGAFVGKVRTSG